jgi:hypothetical protein
MAGLPRGRPSRPSQRLPDIQCMGGFGKRPNGAEPPKWERHAEGTRPLLILTGQGSPALCSGSKRA